MSSLEAKQLRRGCYHGWVVVGAVWLSAVTTLGLSLGSLTLFLHDWSVELHTPISDILYALVPQTAIVAIASPFVGSMADRRNARPIFAVGLLAIAIFMVLMSYVGAVWQIWMLYGTILPIGMTLGGVVPGNALISRWFTKRVGLALGIIGSSYGAAAIVFPPIVARLLPDIGWRGVWRGAGVFTAVIILPAVVAVLRNAPDERDGSEYLVANEVPGGGGHGHHGSGVTLPEIVRSRSFWLLLIAYLPIAALGATVQVSLAPILEKLGFAPTSVGTLLSVFASMGVMGTLVIGLAADRYGYGYPLITLGLLVAVGGALVGYGHSVPLTAAGTVLTGFQAAIWPLIATAAAAEYEPRAVGRAYGTLTFFAPLISLVIIAVTKAEEATGSYGPGLVALAILSVAGGALAFLARKKGRPCSAGPEVI